MSGEGRVILLPDPTRLGEPRRGDAPRVGAPRPVPIRPGAPPREAPRVLLVDDSLSVRKFVGLMLERAGFEVRMAADGGEALNLLADTMVDVVVTDLEMPRVNGFELVQEAVRGGMLLDRDLAERGSAPDLRSVTLEHAPHGPYCLL